MSDIQNNVIKEIHPRISVAPMMDWTRNQKYNSKIKPLQSDKKH